MWEEKWNRIRFCSLKHQKVCYWLVKKAEKHWGERLMIRAFLLPQILFFTLVLTWQQGQTALRSGFLLLGRRPDFHPFLIKHMHMEKSEHTGENPVGEELEKPFNIKLQTRNELWRMSGRWGQRHASNRITPWQHVQEQVQMCTQKGKKH